MLTSGEKYEIDLYKGGQKISVPIGEITVLRSELQARK
jgi:hypothetical protein